MIDCEDGYDAGYEDGHKAASDEVFITCVACDDEEDDEGCCGGALLGCIMAFAASFLTVIACIEGTKFVAWLWRNI